VVFIPKYSLYSARVEGGIPDGIDTYTVNFDMRDTVGDDLTLSDQIRILCNDRDGALHLHFKKLSEAAHSGDGHRSILRLRAEFYGMLCAVTSAQRPIGGYYAIREGADALRSEWNRNEKMKKYAALCNVSETYFYRCFREWTGKSPVEYRNDLRLSHAEAMLRHTDMPIGEIAAVVGFEDAFYFSRTFSARFGLSPKAYRSAARRD
jgi:AraC-like DNA-binding protein